MFPVFTKTPEDVTVRAGTRARLECAATGEPAPEIAWQKDGGDDFPAARERRMHVMPQDHVFFIMEVKSEDQGIYSCTASNAAGTRVANATLNVLGRCCSGSSPSWVFLPRLWCLFCVFYLQRRRHLWSPWRTRSRGRASPLYWSAWLPAAPAPNWPGSRTGNSWPSRSATSSPLMTSFWSSSRLNQMTQGCTLASWATPWGLSVVSPKSRSSMGLHLLAPPTAKMTPPPQGSSSLPWYAAWWAPLWFGLSSSTTLANERRNTAQPQLMIPPSPQLRALLLIRTPPTAVSLLPSLPLLPSTSF